MVAQPSRHEARPAGRWLADRGAWQRTRPDRVRTTQGRAHCVRARRRTASRMTTTGVCVLDPLTDDRWPDFLERHPRASVFHSRGWLEALKRTYRYDPIAL